MIDAILYKDIVKAVNIQFLGKPKRVVFFDGVNPASSNAMANDGAFSSVRASFESIIRYSASRGEGGVWEFSDKNGVEMASSLLKDAILGLLPKTLQSRYRKAESYAVRQI